ncbi:MAG: molybdopterin molybdenumtransferase MoeA, partial [Pseudomonas sp.]
LQADASGQLQVHLHPRQGSAMLSSACWSDGLAVIEIGQTLQAGEAVSYLSFAELLQ